jgi:hypothetical protein
MEESNSWRYPIDLVDILEKAFKELPIVLSDGCRRRERQADEDKKNKMDSNKRSTGQYIIRL